MLTFAFALLVLWASTETTASFQRHPLQQIMRIRYQHQSVSFPQTSSLALNAINSISRSESIQLDNLNLVDINTLSQLSDEEEQPDQPDDDEDENSDESASEPQAVVAVTDEVQQISLIKQGLNISSSLNGSNVRVGIIMARWNSDIISGLYKGVNESLAACGVKPANVFTTYVPGAFELPITARFLAASKRVDVIICLGCLIKGDTMHFEYIAQATAQGIMQVSLESYVPCIFGVLTVLNKEQAIVRSQGAKNEGLSWGASAVEMGLNRMSALGMDKPAAMAGNKAMDMFSKNETLIGGKKNESKKGFGF